jgi:hypothetical protein
MPFSNLGNVACRADNLAARANPQYNGVTKERTYEMHVWLAACY